MQLSDHFSLAELTHSQTADANLIDNTPSAAVAERLRFLCQMCLEPIRDLLGTPLHISSGFRCEQLNRLVGGEPSSQHVRGEAADIVPMEVDLDDAFMAIAQADVPFDQLIREPSWIHVSYAPDREPRRQCLVAEPTDNGMTYRTYSPR